MEGKFLLGATLCVVGLFLTVSSYYSVSEKGNYTIYWGAVIAGLILLFKGWTDERQFKEHEEFKKKVSLGQATTDDWESRGNEFFDAGKYEHAVNFYDVATQVDPRNPTAWVNKSAALYRLGKQDSAMEASERAIEINPKYGAAWHSKRIVLKKLGHKSEARAAFDKSKELGYRA